MQNNRSQNIDEASSSSREAPCAWMPSRDEGRAWALSQPLLYLTRPSLAHGIREGSALAHLINEHCDRRSWSADELCGAGCYYLVGQMMGRVMREGARARGAARADLVFTSQDAGHQLTPLAQEPRA